jgi:death-on-curing family protein
VFGLEEPMPDFDSRYPGKLESCLKLPFAGFGNVEFYEGIHKKAVTYFYFCIKNHPFENGNKRFAIIIMLFFLAKNGLWLNIDPVYLYEVSKAVADENDRPEIVITKLLSAFMPHFEPFNAD